MNHASLILTITRACDLRCAYCPTAKDGWPTLSSEDVERAIDLFVGAYGGGEIKLFGGEPMLEPELIRVAMEKVRDEPLIDRIYLSTNGIGLNEDWIDYLSNYPKAILTISMDGRPEDHRRLRLAREGTKDAYDHICSILPKLIKIPRLVITQTIPPKMAHDAYENFSHLFDLGFRRYNFLPGYFIPWKARQLKALRHSFGLISNQIQSIWRQNKYVYVRNLFINAPTPFFNTGMIVDSDRSIHPSNLGLSGSLDHLREKTMAGDLDNPPTPLELQRKALEVNDLLEKNLKPLVWRSTHQADAELTRFCEGLMPAFLRYKKRKGLVA